MTKQFVTKIIDVIQTLEDIGGPNDLEQYIAVLTAPRRAGGENEFIRKS